MSQVNQSLQELESQRDDEPLANYAAASVRLGNTASHQGAKKALLSGLVLVAIAVGLYALQLTPFLSKALSVGEDIGNFIPVPQQEKNLAENSNQNPLQSYTPTFAVKAKQPGFESSALSSGHELGSEPNSAHTSQLTQKNSVENHGVENHRVENHGNENQENSAEPKSETNKVIAGTVELLLQSASTALLDNRLTTPPHNSAMAYYQQVLILHPGHPAALAGLDAIVYQYADLAENQLKLNLYDDALAFTQSGLSISPQNTRLLDLRSKILASRTTSTTPKPDRISANTRPDTKHPDAELTVTPSKSNTDSQQVMAARAKIERGDVEQALSDLEQSYQAGSIGQKGMRLLANLYLQEQRTDDAKTLLQDQTLLSKAEAAYIIARSQVQTNNLAGAITTLESQSPNFSKNPDYYALLAGIYQQGGQHRHAIALYKQLTLIQPKVFTHWLGLAAALDKRREPTALAAFKRVQPMIPSQRTELKQYVQQRIIQLSKTQPST